MQSLPPMSHRRRHHPLPSPALHTHTFTLPPPFGSCSHFHQYSTGGATITYPSLLSHAPMHITFSTEACSQFKWVSQGAQPSPTLSLITHIHTTSSIEVMQSVPSSSRRGRHHPLPSLYHTHTTSTTGVTQLVRQAWCVRRHHPPYCPSSSHTNTTSPTVVTQSVPLSSCRKHHPSYPTLKNKQPHPRLGSCS